MNIRTAAGTVLAMAAWAWITPASVAQPITTHFSVGDFTYQFADPTTGQPITSLTIPAVGDTAQVSVYLLQQGGTPTNFFQQVGVEGVGVRLNYASPAGFVMVPNTLNASITGRPPPAHNPNGNSSDFDGVNRYGTGTGTNTSSSAAISDELYSKFDPLPFPGAEDPLGISNRFLIATFTFQALALGTESVTAVSGPSAGINILTGPNPPIMMSRNDGTTGPVPGNGTQGEISIDRYLAQNLGAADIPDLAITIEPPGVLPEPSTLALGFMAAAGLAIRRRRRRPGHARPLSLEAKTQHVRTCLGNGWQPPDHKAPT